MRSPTERRKLGLLLLTEAAPGLKYTVISVYERDRKLLEFFDTEGIRPGTRVSVSSRNYDGTLSLTIGTHQIRLGSPAAERVWISKA